MGNTKVLCVASVENKVPPFIEQQGLDQGWVTAEYALLPRAGRERTPRQRGAGGGRSQEISRLIGRSLRGVVDLHKLGKRSIVLDCDVLRADGGTRTASINGAYIALFMALKKLQRTGEIQAWPLNDYLGAVSVGIVGGKRILDLDAKNDNIADVDMNVVMTGSGRFIEVQGTAEHQPYSRTDLDGLLAAAAAGIRSVIAIEKKVLGPVR
jgi:ribonuclease PH